MIRIFLADLKLDHFDDKLFVLFQILRMRLNHLKRIVCHRLNKLQKQRKTRVGETRRMNARGAYAVITSLKRETQQNDRNLGTDLTIILPRKGQTVTIESNKIMTALERGNVKSPPGGTVTRTTEGTIERTSSSSTITIAKTTAKRKIIIIKTIAMRKASKVMITIHGLVTIEIEGKGTFMKIPHVTGVMTVNSDTDVDEMTISIVLI